MQDDSDHGNVSKLPVQFKAPPDEERSLLLPYEVARPPKCNHLFVQFIVDERSATVECGKCGESLSPMWVLSRLANEESHHNRIRQNYHNEMERLNKRSRTKCMNCGKMTRISDR